jgi:hypothetical protein
MSKKQKLIAFILILLSIIITVFLFSRAHIYNQDELSYGVTFSSEQAKYLGLDWKKTYTDILDDLGFKKLRLSAYWNQVEKDKNNFSYVDLDWQVDEAGKRGAEIILAVGGRLPRWPECHFPNWAKDLSEAARKKATLDYIQNTINHYKNYKQIIAWQIENEPFLPHFGECPSLDKNFLDQEIALARSLDSRPIVITDSGELSIWIPAAARADIFGTTMYRDTYSQVLKAYIHYPIGSWFFRLKKNIVNLFAHPQKWVVIELAAEPWAPISYDKVSEAERNKTMSPKKLKEDLEFARQTGFQEFYLWGAEYWAWEKGQGRGGMWEIIKSINN